VTKIEANATIENQFFVKMSSTDVNLTSKQDSLLLFQFSRPQNLIKFWKFKIELSQVRFMDTDPAVLLAINKNQEMQRIYCCDNKLQLKKKGTEKVQRKENMKTKLDQEVADSVKVDYGFIRNEGRLTQAMSKKQRVEQVLAPVLANAETQIRRLDEADR